MKRKNYFLRNEMKRKLLFAKRNENVEAKNSETKRKIIFLFSRKIAKKKRNGIRFVIFRIEAKN